MTPSGAAATEFDLDGDGVISRDELKKGALQFQEVKRKNVGLGVAVGMVSLIVLLLLGIIAGIVGGGASEAARARSRSLARFSGNRMIPYPPNQPRLVFIPHLERWRRGTTSYPERVVELLSKGNGS